MYIYCQIPNKQCNYSSLQERCEHCSKRNLHCVKVWGPEKRKAQDVLLDVSGDTLPLMSSISMISDSDLSERELFYLRCIYMHNSKYNYWLSPIVQHLWHAYGLIFTDKTLLYSVMAEYVVTAPESERLPQQMIDYYYFKSIFHRNLMVKIRRNEILETHLFAILFAIVGCINEPGKSDSELRVHQRGFLEISKLLTSQQSREKVRVANPLQYLYKHVLSLVWRMSSCWEEDNYMMSVDYQTYQLTESLPVPETILDPRTTLGLPPCYWKYRDPPTWETLTFSLYDNIRALYGCFQTSFRTTKERSRVATTGVNIAVCTIRTRISDMHKLPWVDKVLLQVIQWKYCADLIVIGVSWTRTTLPMFFGHHLASVFRACLFSASGNSYGNGISVARCETYANLKHRRPVSSYRNHMLAR